MLKPPYQRYRRLYTYHLDRPGIEVPQDPDLIGGWEEDDTTILFFHRPKERLVQELCRESGSRLIYAADLDYQEWEAGREITPFTVRGCTVAPVWEEAPADIRLDPSVIFGSGFHPSTRLCMEAVLDLLDRQQPRIRSAMDLGCGTGLLSILAAQKGVDTVLAVDNNPLACQVTRANVRRNRVENRVSVRLQDLRKEVPATRGCDLVVANLYKGLLAELMARETFWQAKWYVLSGFIPVMEEELLCLLPQDKVRFLSRLRSERWCLWVLAGTCKAG